MFLHKLLSHSIELRRLWLIATKNITPTTTVWPPDRHNSHIGVIDLPGIDRLPE
jgi:hypothetical protein